MQHTQVGITILTRMVVTTASPTAVSALLQGAHSDTILLKPYFYEQLSTMCPNCKT